MHKFVVFQVYSHVGYAVATAGAEKDEVSLTQLLQVDNPAVYFKHLCRIAVEFDALHILIDHHHHAGAVGADAFVLFGVGVWRSQPTFQLLIEFLVVIPT